MCLDPDTIDIGRRSGQRLVVKGEGVCLRACVCVCVQ